MDTGQICLGCRKPLASGTPQGLCPECLIKAGLGTGVDIGPDSQSESHHAWFVAPSIEELAKVFPQLEILGFIGQGGMGAVYKARQKSLDRVVALKILPPGIGDNLAFAERFAREAKALARLNHSGIVTLYEFGQADGQFYFLMEFVDGVNLRHLLEAGRLSPREALAIVPQLCDALQYAHDQGIVHRDIKPENILLDRLGRVKVADFGLAKLVETAEETSYAQNGIVGAVVLTEAGKVMGTPQYMAPEQSGNPASVDHRADIYSLGVVLYQMLTGELPGKPLQPPSQKVQIDVRLDEVVLRALEKEPQLRYQQVSMVKTAVESITQSPSQDEVASNMSAQSPSTSVGTLIKSARCRFTTPEYLNTAMGGFWCFMGKGELSLFPDRLVYRSGWQHTEIPFANLTGLCLARLSRSRSPVGHTLLSIIFNDAGQTRRLLFFPGEGLFRFAGDSRDDAIEWLVAIRNAAKAATGNSFPDMSEKPDVVQASLWGILAMFAPLLLIQGYFLLTLATPPRAYSPEAVTSPLVSLLPPFIIFMTFCFFLGYFLVSSLLARRKRKMKDISIPQAPPQEEVKQQLVGWRRFVPFQSLKAREICAHMTKEEKHEATLRGLMFGGWIAATWFGSFFAYRLIPEPMNLISTIIFLVGLAGIPIWRRIQREFLCTTAWARQRAFQPNQLVSTGIVVVGRRDGRAAIRWRGVLLAYLWILVGIEAGTIYSYTIFPMPWTGLAVGFAFVGAVLLTGYCVLYALRTPVEYLTSLDGTGEMGPNPTDEGKSHATAMKQESSSTKHMSRAAVWGAIWTFISLSFLFLIGLRMIGPERVSFSSWISLLLLPLIVLGLTGPFGATILGWLSVSQIRRSAGRLYGRKLAVFDGLLFPLLMMNYLIGQMWCIVISCVLGILSGFSKHFSTVPYDNRHNALDTLLVDHRVWFVFALALPICGVLDYFIVRSVWRAVNKPLVPLQPTTDTISTPNTGFTSRSKRTWKNTMWVCLLLIVPFVLFLSYVTSIKPASTNTERASFKYWGFEVDATEMDRMLPVEQRRIDAGNGLKAAEITPETRDLLLKNRAPNPGLLVDQQRTISGWPRVADTWAYVKGSNADNAVGGGTGLFGVWRKGDHQQVRIEYQINHRTDTQGPANVKILYEGASPQTGVLAFLVPLTGKDVTVRYLVVMFEVMSSFSTTLPPQKTGAMESAPFVARFPQGTIELVAISSHPSTPDQPWWRPDGTPYTGEPFDLRNSRSYADQNELGREFVLRSKGFPEDVPFPVMKLEPSTGAVCGGVYSIGKRTPDLHGVAATIPKSTRTVMVKVGISVGPWEKVIESKAENPHM